MVCLHGFADTWRSWELVLPALERQHDVLALTLPGHAGGPPLQSSLTDDTLVDQVERCIHDAGMDDAHVVGNSLGGYWPCDWPRADVPGQWSHSRPRAGGPTATPGPASCCACSGGCSSRPGRRLRTPMRSRRHRRVGVARRRLITTNFEHIPPDLIASQTVGIASAPEANRMLEYAQRARWGLDAERIGCPVRIVWGTADKLLRWPDSAVRYRTQLLPHAEWIELDGIGHCPQLDVPLETAQLILGFTA